MSYGKGSHLFYRNSFTGCQTQVLRPLHDLWKVAVVFEASVPNFK